MNTTDFVTYDQAWILNKLRYTGEIEYIYFKTNSKLQILPTHEYLCTGFAKIADKDSSVAAYKLSKVHQWLIEKGIYIMIIPQSKNLWDFDLIQIETNHKIYSSNIKYNSYNEALSDGITETLKILQI